MITSITAKRSMKRFRLILSTPECRLLIFLFFFFGFSYGYFIIKFSRAFV